MGDGVMIMLDALIEQSGCTSILKDFSVGDLITQ